MLVQNSRNVIRLSIFPTGKDPSNLQTEAYIPPTAAKPWSLADCIYVSTAWLDLGTTNPRRNKEQGEVPTVSAASHCLKAEGFSPLKSGLSIGHERQPIPDTQLYLPGQRPAPRFGEHLGSAGWPQDNISLLLGAEIWATSCVSEALEQDTQKCSGCPIHRDI